MVSTILRFFGWTKATEEVVHKRNGFPCSEHEMIAVQVTNLVQRADSHHEEQKRLWDAIEKKVDRIHERIDDILIGQKQRS